MSGGGSHSDALATTSPRSRRAAMWTFSFCSARRPYHQKRTLQRTAALFLSLWPLMMALFSQSHMSDVDRQTVRNEDASEPKHVVR